MKILLRYMSAALVAVMLLGVFASCKKEEPTPTPSTDSESQTTLDSESESESESEGQSGNEGEGGNEGDGGNEGEGGNEGGDGNENERINLDVISTKSLNTTVMSFNIRNETGESLEINNWDNRKEAVYSFILNCGASIIGMQEVKKSQYTDLKAGISDKYEVIWYAAYTGSNGAGNAVAYDKSVWQVVGTPEHFWLSPTPDVQSKGWQTSHYRSCINILFEHIETGAKFNVFATHLDHRYTVDRVNGISLILERMGESEYPVYLCGDFNCTPESDAYAIASAALQDAQVNALDSDEGSTFVGWEGSFTDEDKYVIDYCFFSKDDVVPLTYRICDDKWGENNENQLSDHRPIKTEVRLIYELKELYPNTTEGGFDCNMDTVSAE